MGHNYVGLNHIARNYRGHISNSICVHSRECLPLGLAHGAPKEEQLAQVALDILVMAY